MTAAIYLRVSTLNQSSGLEAQERAVKDYLNIKGIHNFKIYADEGISGAKASRPNLDKMMEDVKNGLIKNVFVYSFSRFARNTRHLLTALELFNTLNVNFISVSESIDTSTPLGKTIFSIIAAISELERELIKERVVNGLKNAKAKGKRLGAKKRINDNLILELAKQKMSHRKIATLLKISKTSVQRVLVGSQTSGIVKSGPDL